MAYYSKGFNNKNLGLSIYEKEYLAIIHAIEKLRSYLTGKHFTIKTDHQSLKFHLEQKIITTLQQKRLIKLLGLDFSIVHKKGAENGASDTLSRKAKLHQCLVQHQAITTTIPKWLEDITLTYKEDDWSKESISAVQIYPENQPNLSLLNGVLKYKNRIYVGQTRDLREWLIKVMYDLALGEHSGQ